MIAPSVSHYDVIVAGVGSMGSAASYHLAKRGAKVLGLEQFDIPHDRGSHHGHSRMIRQAYFEHPDYVPLLKRAYALWDELQAEAAAGSKNADPFFFRTGGIYIGAEGGTIVPGSLRAAEEHGLPFGKLGPRQLADRYPQFKTDPTHVGVFESEAGFLVPEATVAAHAKAATRFSADLRPNEPLFSYQSHQNGVTVKTRNTTYTADHLVLTSGAWTSKVAQDLGIPLTVTRQVLAWFEIESDPSRFLPENFPCWFIETDPPFGHYGFPYRDGDPGLKIALHKPGDPIDPDSLSEDSLAPTDGEIAALRTIFETYFPGAVRDVAHSSTCLYTNSPDGHFILGAHPKDENVTIACGFSGHGFKFASVVGEILAGLATNGTTDLPIDFLRPDRSIL